MTKDFDINDQLAKVREYGKKYTLRGWHPVPCVGKKPARWTTKVNDKGNTVKTSKGYNKLRLEEDDIEDYFDKERLGINKNIPLNIAIVADSNKRLTDIDLDSETARLLSPSFLPDTMCMFGRKTSRGSHKLYSVKHSTYKKFYYLKDLNKKKGGDNEVTLLEIRPLDGARYTVFPPSVHESTGENIAWEKNRDGSFIYNKDPAEVEVKDLEECCRELAVATVIADELSEGTRQELILALSGTLFKLGWDKDRVTSFTKPILEQFDDQKDFKDRMQGIDATWRKFNKGEAITGVSKLKELLSPPQFQVVKDWLGISKSESPIIEEDGCLVFRMFIKDMFINSKISSFVMRPVKSSYVPEDGNHFDVELISKMGTSRMIKFGPRSFISSRAFKESVSRVQDSQEFSYIGNDNQTQLLNEYLAGQEYARVKGTKITGFVEEDGIRYFVTEDGCLSATKEGIVLNDSISYVGRENSYCKLPFTPSPKKKDLFSIKKDLLSFNTPSVVQGVLGWSVSCFYKQYFMDEASINGFPLLYMSGESGSGKSQTAKSIIYGIWDVQENPLDFKGQTEFTLMLGSTMSNAIPIVLDEVKLNRLGIKYQNIFSRYVRAAFDDSKMKRGNKDQTATHYSIQRPTVVCSEVWPNETAIKERCLFLNLSQKESYQYTEAYKRLIGQDLGMIGRLLLDDALMRKEENVYEILLETYDKLPKSFEGRPALCLLSVAFGCRILSDLLKIEIGTEEITEELFNHFYSHVDGDTMMFKTSEVDKTIVEFNRMCEYEGNDPTFGSMVHNTHLLDGHHYAIKDGMLRLYLNGVLPIFHKFAKEYDYDGDILDKQTFANQVKNEVYFVEEKVAKIGDRPRRCIILDITKMVNKGLDISHPWVDLEETKQADVISIKKEEM